MSEFATSETDHSEADPFIVCLAERRAKGIDEDVALGAALVSHMFEPWLDVQIAPPCWAVGPPLYPAISTTILPT
jgi:hypothetical protein